MSDEPTTGYAEIRRVLLNAEYPLTVGEVFEACSQVRSTTDVASMLHVECIAGRAERTGTKGSYQYELTEAGRRVAENPRLLRGRSNRRMRGRGLPAMPAHAASRE